MEARHMAIPEKKAQVKLIGQDGNAFAILARCLSAGRRAGYTKEQLAEFQKQATSGNYDHLLCTCLEWFEEESEEEDEDEEGDDESCPECATDLDEYNDCPNCCGLG
jgi:hypothetical protein